MKKLLLRSVSATALAALIVVSCSKKDGATTTPADMTANVELTTAKINSDAYYDDVAQEVLQVNTDNGLTSQPSTTNVSCATVTVTPLDPAVWPKTVTIDYGTTGCTGANGNVRTGVISYTISQKLINTGATLTVTFQNYTVNGYKLEGTYTITNNGIGTNGLNVTVKLDGGKITYPDGRWFTRNSNTTWVQSAGATTLAVADDEYNLTGSGVLTSSAGNTLTVSSKTPLLRKVSCMNTVSGILNLTFNNISGVLNYGDGTCDKVATLTVAGKDYAITLP